MKFVTTTDEGGTPVTLPLAGFQTPPLGPVDTRVGFVAYEGDQGNTGDFALLDCKPLGNSANPLPSPNGTCAFQGGDFFNSSLSIDNVHLANKSPAWLDPSRINQLGFDADIVGASGYLTNNQTTASIRLQTVGDGYAPGAVTFATELFAPRIESTKGVTPPVPCRRATGSGTRCRSRSRARRGQRRRAERPAAARHDVRRESADRR